MLVKQQGAQEDSKWVSRASFTQFTSWKHGVDPLRIDSAQRRLDYLKICQQVSTGCLVHDKPHTASLLDQPLWFKMLNADTVCLQQHCKQGDSLKNNRAWPSMCTFASRTTTCCTCRCLTRFEDVSIYSELMTGG